MHIKSDQELDDLINDDGVYGRQQNEKGRYPAVGPTAAAQLCGTKIHVGVSQGNS